MSRVLRFAVALIVACAATAAQAQPAGPADAAVPTAPRAPAPPAPPVPAAQPVEITALAAPDAFTTPAHDTGLPPTLWRGTSVQVVKAVLPLLAEKPLSPAAAALARRLLATGAQGPEGAGQDPALVAGRAAALMAQGDPRGAATILARAPGLDRSADLARVAAESALLAGQDPRACQIEQALTAGRDDIYWVRLRTYCQAIAGKTAEAQLTFDLAQSQAKDVAFTRLMAAKLAGAGDPGAPSLRNGLDYALSRNLGLDLSLAKPSPAVAAALAQGAPAEPKWAMSDFPPDLAGAAGSLIEGGDAPNHSLDSLLGSALADKSKASTRAQAAALLLTMVAGEPLSNFSEYIAAMSLPEGKAPLGRNLALEAAEHEKSIGGVAILALWTCAQAGPSGLSLGDRIRIVHALEMVGLKTDARAFALEGLAALK
ncbi:MAG: fliK [Phenylobacterium sp.]|nr:fliK [Phenylobacterium sp.]